jgi:hypothetical protein
MFTMPIMVIIVHQTPVVLKFPRRMADVIIKAQEMLELISTNTYLPNPIPGIADFKASIMNLVIAEAKAATKEAGSVAARNAALKAMKVLAEQMRLIV